jgi:hypothetical protein
MYYISHCGRIQLTITKKQVALCSHPDHCDADVLALSKVPAIARQLAKVDAGVLRKALDGYGVWDAVELADHAQNLQRLLWIACGDISDNEA